MKIHEDITLDRVLEAVEQDDLTGFCITCGSEQGRTEPDAGGHYCECCGEASVWGAEQLLIAGDLS